MARNGLVMSFAPVHCVLVFLGSVASGLAVGNEPCRAMLAEALTCTATVWRSQHTDRPAVPDNLPKDLVELPPILDPVAADQRHAHSPQTPSKEGYPLELLLCEPAAPPEHAGRDGKCLNHVEVRP